MRHACARRRRRRFNASTPPTCARSCCCSYANRCERRCCRLRLHRLPIGSRTATHIRTRAFGSARCAACSAAPLFRCARGEPARTSRRIRLPTSDPPSHRAGSTTTATACGGNDARRTRRTTTASPLTRRPRLVGNELRGNAGRKRRDRPAGLSGPSTEAIRRRQALGPLRGHA